MEILNKKPLSKQKQQSRDNFFKKIKEIDTENRWNYDEVYDLYDGVDTPVPITCNSCFRRTMRSPDKHLRTFANCMNKCYNKLVVKKEQFKEYKLIEPLVVEDNLIEEWKPLNQHKNYIISNYGKIKNIITNKELKGYIKSGYNSFTINKKCYNAHYLVASNFIPNNENKPTVNHINKNKLDNRVNNLEWATPAEQNSHKNYENKKYKNNTNGQIILQLNKDTNELINSFSTYILANNWILQNIYNIDTEKLDVFNKLKSMSNTMKRCILRSKNNWLKFGYIWKLEEPLLELPNEIWKEIPKEIINNDKKYEISNFGRFKDINSKIKNKMSICSNGYYEVKINKKHFKIHLLVAKIFIPNIENKPFVNHKDGNKLNNNVLNLEWVTQSENTQHAYDIGLCSNTRKIIQYDKEGINIINEFNSIMEASRKLNICNSSIYYCCKGITMVSGNYHFKYKENIDNPKREKKENHTCAKKVNMYDKNNNLIQSFISTLDTARYFNVLKGQIFNRLKGKISKNPILNEYIFKQE